MKNKFILTMLTLFLTTQAGFCRPLTIKEVIVKFSSGMGVALISVLIIFLGVVLYNKIRSNKNVELTPEEEVLRTPKSVDEAVKFYIRKNRLK